MDDIKITKPDKETVAKTGITRWPIWRKEASRFDWQYDEMETCYILEGEATVTPKNGKPASFGPGDLVVFPSGMQCVWEIKKEIKKHYKFG